MKRVYVTIEGGIVTGVVTDDASLVGLSVGIIDYDTNDSGDDEDWRTATFTQGKEIVRAFVGEDNVTYSAFDLAPAHELLA